MTKAFDIAGYTFQADLYCPDHILPRLRRAWVDRGVFVHDYSELPTDQVEDVLSGLAAYHGIDRMNETSFDSDRFPKVVFDDQVEENDCCGECGNPL